MLALLHSQVVSVSYILPLPHFHGNMAARARGITAAKFIPTRFVKCLEPWSLYSAFGRSRTKPYMPLNSYLSGLPAPAGGVSFNLAEEWQHLPPASPAPDLSVSTV